MNKMSEAALATTSGFSLEPRNIKEAMEYAEIIANSEMVPKDFKGKPGNVLVAVQMGQEVGLKAMQALQNIAVINGRPSIWGDASIAIVRNSPLCAGIKETFDPQTMTATCRVIRKGEAEEVRTFSKSDADVAGLWKKAGPWTQHPKRMLQMRARAFALRDVFPDVLKGFSIAEEVRDMVDITSESSVTSNEPLKPTKADVLKEIEGAETQDDLLIAGDKAAQLPEGEREEVRNAYRYRRTVLTNEAEESETKQGEVVS